MDRFGKPKKIQLSCHIHIPIHFGDELPILKMRDRLLADQLPQRVLEF